MTKMAVEEVRRRRTPVTHGGDNGMVGTCSSPM